MIRKELKQLYFKWMYDLSGIGERGSYFRLFEYLYNEDFVVTLDMDDNRAADGIDLRYRFGIDQGHESPMIATYLDDHPCSVLEMILALAVRCEENIMGDPEFGNRIPVWVSEMLTNLGLINMDDAHFNSHRVENIIHRFMNREYEPDGTGGLFRIRNCKEDLRKIEIWYQLCWYLDSIFPSR